MLRFLLIFFYLFPISFSFIPFGLTTRIWFSIFGFFLLIVKLIFGKEILIQRNILKIIYLMVGFVILSFISLSINGSFDLQFVLYPFSLLLILFASFLIIHVFNYNFDVIIKYLIFAILVQNILSLIMFIYPNVGQFLNSIQNISELDQLKFGELSELRLLGFGSSFFGSGIINCFGLLLITYSYVKSINKPYRFYYVFLFLVIGFIGVLKARTTFLGILLSIIYLIITNKKKLVRFLSTSSLLIFTLGTIILSLLLKFNPNTDILLKFGFEMFDNFFTYGSLESDSTNELAEMYQYPTELRTWIIGDGHWNSIIPGDYTYYKNTDVGFLRMIYYFGLFGTIFFFWFHIKVLSLIRIEENNKNIVIIFSILLLILNFKGFTDIFFLIILFVFQKPFNAKKQTSSYSYSR